MQRSVAMFAIWEQAFGGTDRLVRTLSVFTGLPQNDLPDLDWQGASAHLDALAIGPYFSLNGDMSDATAISRMTVPEVLDSCLANIDVVMSAVAQHRANASSRGLDLVAYEGGQNLVGRGAAQTDPTVIALFSAANRDPGMQGVYAYYMGQWRLMGGHQFCHFASMQQYDTVWGAFGIFEWNDQPTTPKCAALTEFITGDPRWW